MAAYMVAQLRVHDVQTCRRYALQVGETVRPFGGRLLVANDEPVVLEGAQPYPRTLIGEFPSTAAAQSWYGSAEYQAIQPLRAASTDGTVLLIEGMSLPWPPDGARDDATTGGA